MKNVYLFLVVVFLPFVSINSSAKVGASDNLNCDGIQKSTNQSESWKDGDTAATHLAILDISVGTLPDSDSSRVRPGSRSSGGNDEGSGGTSGGSSSGKGDVQ